MTIDSILWILKTGAPWRDLLPEFGPWQTVYKRFAKCAKLDVRDDILKELSEDSDSESVSIDAFYIKVHQHGTGAKGGTANRHWEKAKAA